MYSGVLRECGDAYNYTERNCIVEVVYHTIRMRSVNLLFEDCSMNICSDLCIADAGNLGKIRLTRRLSKLTAIASPDSNSTHVTLYGSRRVACPGEGHVEWSETSLCPRPLERPLWHDRSAGLSCCKHPSAHVPQRDASYGMTNYLVGSRWKAPRGTWANLDSTLRCRRERNLRALW